MNKKGMIIFGVIFVIILGYFVSTYNKFQALDEKVSSNWAQVENQLKRRNDLIPNLINTVKGYSKHEKEIFTQVSEARTKLVTSMSKKDIQSVQKDTTELNNTLSRLIAIAENYPTLKADKNFIALQDELAGTENRISVARRDYNESVKALNTYIRMFPASLIATIANVEPKKYFEITEGEKTLLKVEF